MVKNLIAYSLMIIICGCSKESKTDQCIVLFDKIEKIIIENSESEFDTIKIIRSHNSIEKIFLKENRILIKETYSSDTSILYGRTRYSADGKFEVRNEISKSGTITTNGFAFKGECYGPWKHNFDDGQNLYTFFRYKDIDFGDEEHFNQAGRIVSTVHHDNEQYFDSLILKFEPILKEMQIKRL